MQGKSMKHDASKIHVYCFVPIRFARSLPVLLQYTLISTQDLAIFLLFSVLITECLFLSWTQEFAVSQYKQLLKLLISSNMQFDRYSRRFVVVVVAVMYIIGIAFVWQFFRFCQQRCFNFRPSWVQGHSKVAEAI